MNKFFISVASLLLAVLLVGCTNSADGGETASVDTKTEDFAVSENEMFTKRDLDASYSESDAVRITLGGDSITSNSPKAKIDGTIVTLDSEETYIISGSLNNGCVIVDAPDTAKLQIVLDGADITSNTSAALFVRCADKVVVTLAEGTENRLSNGGVFEINDEDVDGAVFACDDITFNGNGKLVISSPEGKGIVAKDDVVFTSGSYDIDAVSHGVDANDSIRVKEASLLITSGKDALHAENSDDSSLGFVYFAEGSISAESKGDGISAGAHMQIDGGSFTLTTGGNNDTSASMKGLKAKKGILINGGAFSIVSDDDAIHSDTDVTVNGGKLELSTGDDGIHAASLLTVTAGDVKITDSYEGFEAEDISILGGNIEINATDDGINSAGGTDGSNGEDGFDAAPMRPTVSGKPAGPGGNEGRPQGPAGPGGPGAMPVGDGSVVISGGNIYIIARGDGIDVNGRLEITGGSITVTGPTVGDTATLDFDTAGVITGGTFIGTGGTMMPQTFSDSSQGVISLRVGNQNAGTEITVADKSGKVIFSAVPKLDFAIVIVSSPELTKGESYNVTVGTQSGEFTAD